jgi:hypothetical protein
MALAFLCFAAAGPAADLKPDLAADLAFQKSIANYYLQTARWNTLDAQFERELSDFAKQLQQRMEQQHVAVKAAEDLVKKACPGEVTGLQEGTPECKPKVDKPADKSSK